MRTGPSCVRALPHRARLRARVRRVAAGRIPALVGRDTARMPSTPPAPDARPLEAATLGPPGVILLLSGATALPVADPVGEEERADPAVVARAEARGELVRLRAGVHVERVAWEAVSARERHLLRIRALARVSPAPVALGGASAAAVHALPRLAPWPLHVTLLDVPDLPPGRRAGTRIARDPSCGRSPVLRGPGGVRLPTLAATALAASHDAAVAAVSGAAAPGPGWSAHGLLALDDALAPWRVVPVTRAELHVERELRGAGPWSRRAELRSMPRTARRAAPWSRSPVGSLRRRGWRGRPSARSCRVTGGSRWPGRCSGSGSGSAGRARAFPSPSSPARRRERRAGSGASSRRPRGTCWRPGGCVRSFCTRGSSPSGVRRALPGRRVRIRATAGRAGARR